MPGIDVFKAMGVVIQIRPEEGREHIGCGVEIKMVVDLLYDLLAGVDLTGMSVQGGVQIGGQQRCRHPLAGNIRQHHRHGAGEGEKVVVIPPDIF